MSLEYSRAFDAVPIDALMRLHGAQTESDLREQTGQAWHNANSAIRNNVPRLLVALPVSFQETPDTVRTTLEQFEAQRRQGAPPFSISINCNGLPGHTAQPLTDTIRTFQAEHPELPTTFFVSAYPEGTAIGKIKKDTVDVGLAIIRQFLRTGQRLPEPLAIVSEDIDLVRMSRDLLSKLYLEIRSGADLAQANRRHARSNGRFPNMDRVMFWYDLPILFSSSAMHDTHNMMAARSYILAGGVAANDDRFEGIQLQKHAKRAVLSSYTAVRPVGAFVVTSARRAYWEMQHKRSPETMWDNRLEVEEDYRNARLEDFRDISVDMADEMIAHLNRETNFFGRGQGLFDAVKMGFMHSRLATAGVLRVMPSVEEEALHWAKARVQRIQKIAQAITEAA